MFGSVLEKLDGWFGKSFVVASLLPVLIFGGANALMAQFVFPQALTDTLAYFSTWPFAPLEATAALLIICAIVAYATDPWVRLTMNVLRGVNWPTSVAALGIADENAKLRALDEDKRGKGELSARLTKPKCDELISKLIDARLRGIAIGVIGMPAKIQDAERRVRAIERLRDRGETIDLPALDQAVGALAEALESNCADRDKLLVIDLRSEGSGVEAAQCERLDALYRNLKGLIEYARKHAESEWTAAVNWRNSRMPQKNVAPTELGNKYAALNDYLDEIFNIDIDFFLPIIRMIVTKDKETSDMLASAQQRLDFAARTLVLVILFAIIWLVAVVVTLKSVAAVALVGSGGLIVGALVVEVIKASFDSYSETVRAVCILKRFEVLTALHMKLPGNWAAEQRLWKSINEQLQWNSPKPNEIDYEHPDK